MPHLLIGLICVLVITSLSWAKSNAKSQKETLNFSGKQRTYYVFAPPGLTAPAPLLLLLHGSSHDGRSLIDPWKGLAQKKGLTGCTRLDSFHNVGSALAWPRFPACGVNGSGIQERG
ncbi:MAG: hypothetical protein ABSE28_09750 [Candidatus Sulfotelmatobacter sp.]|jgi:hypothetical protein